jgi:hypothetical protein
MYNEPLLYLDCDTGIIMGQDHLYDLLMDINYPCMDANEDEYSGQLYGETFYFKPQVMDIKIYFYRSIITQDRNIQGFNILGQKYPVTNATKNNGILYFPATDLGRVMACEIINVYEKLMDIYAYGFNDLNASTCVFDQHNEIPCRTLIPHRFLIDTEKKHYDVSTHLEQQSIPLTHYFTISWQYYGAQNDPSGYEKIITIYKEIMLSNINKVIEQDTDVDWAVISGTPYQVCENLLETILFGTKLIGVFHPLTSDKTSFASILRKQINQFLRIKKNCFLLSYITFILLIQKDIWSHLLNMQTITDQDWFDPTEHMIDINQLVDCVKHELQQNQLPVEDIIRLLEKLTSNSIVQQFLQIAMEKYPTNMLLTKDSPNYCPEYETIVKGIELNNTELINKYLGHLDPNQIDQSGNNLLHYSIIYHQFEMQNLLQSHRTLEKCDVNIKNSNGETPLHLAVKNNSCDAIKLLLKSSADYTLTDMNGKTAKKLAQEMGHNTIYDLLSMYETKQLYSRHRRRPM